MNILMNILNSGINQSKKFFSDVQIFNPSFNFKVEVIDESSFTLMNDQFNIEQGKELASNGHKSLSSVKPFWH